MCIKEENLDFVIAFAMGFSDSTSFKNKNNVFNEGDEVFICYEKGYQTGKDLMADTIQDLTTKN